MAHIIKTLVAGIVVWVIALVIEIARGASTQAIWICVTGAGLGFIGMRYTVRRGRREKI
jgi:hypothetical protein